MLLTLLACAASDPCDQAGVICTIAGTGVVGFSEDGLPATESMLYWPSALRWHPDGRLLVDDFNAHRIRALEPDGTLRTIAGDGFHEGSDVGAPARETSLDNPVDFDFLPDGRMVVAPLHESLVRQVDGDDVVQPFAGTGYWGYAGDGGPAPDAQLGECWGVAAGDDGSVYVADTDNHAVRVVSPDGVIETIAGTGAPGFQGDGGEARHAQLTGPKGLWLDGDLLYVADSGNHVVRRIDLVARTIETFAGTGTSGFSGDGGAASGAQLSAPEGGVVGADGSVWIADTANHIVRRVDPDGTITTPIGNGQEAFGGDLGPPAAASLSFPRSLLFGEEGDLYVADLGNSAVRRVRGAL